MVYSALSDSTTTSQFTRRKKIHINSSVDGALTAFQIKLTIAYETAMQVDFNDVRFSELDSSYIYHWLESKTDSSTADIWIKTDVPASGGKDIYIFYGNSSLLDGDDGDNTFEFFDGFDGVAGGDKFEDFSKYDSNPLTIPEYSANGAVHPSVLYFSDGIDGYKYWMVYTPYPPESEEDPSVIRSNDGTTWVDTGISNPVTSGTETWRGQHQHDPDMIYVSDYSKWFMVWGGAATSGTAVVAFAYSSDGKTWTEYDGTAINGNTNPVILSGEDTGGETWEVTGGVSKVSCPTLIYESGTFYFYYTAQIPTNNQGKGGLVTFTWNNTTNDIENFSRNAGNPIIDLSSDATYKVGCGHLDVSKYGSTYYMYMLRELSGSVVYELVLLTSTNRTTWGNQETVLQKGASGQWDDKYAYKACPVTDGTGNVVLFSDEVVLYYSAFKVSTGYCKIGIAYGTDIIQELDSTVWTKTDDTPIVTVSNSKLTMAGTASASTGKGTLSSWAGDHAIRSNIALKGDRSYAGFSSSTDDASASAHQTMAKRYSGNANFYSTVGDGVDFAHVFSTYAKDTDFHIVEIRRTSTTAVVDVDGTSWSNNTYADNDSKFVWISAFDSSGIECEWILVRKYTLNDPTTSIGTEQHRRRIPMFM